MWKCVYLQFYVLWICELWFSWCIIFDIICTLDLIEKLICRLLIMKAFAASEASLLLTALIPLAVTPVSLGICLCECHPAHWPIDGGGHENQIRPQQVLDQRKRDGCSLVNDQQFSLAQFHSITWVDVLLITGTDVTCAFSFPSHFGWGWDTKETYECTWIVCRCSLKIFTRTTALLNSGFKDWMIS